MNLTKAKIKAKQDYKAQASKNPTPRGHSPLAKALKRLSFSFYA